MREMHGHQRRDGGDKADGVGMKKILVAEPEVGHDGKAPGDDCDDAGARDVALHDGGGLRFGDAVAQEKPDDEDVGDPGDPEAGCFNDGRGGPDDAEESKGEECCHPSQRESAKTGSGKGGFSADREEGRGEEEREADGGGYGGCEGEVFLKEQNRETGSEGEEEADESGQEQGAGMDLTGCR